MDPFEDSTMAFESHGARLYRNIPVARFKAPSLILLVSLKAPSWHSRTTSEGAILTSQWIVYVPEPRLNQQESVAIWARKDKGFFLGFHDMFLRGGW